MLTLTFVPTGAAVSAGLVLCNTSRSLAELNVRFNHKRVISVDNLATALGAGTAAFAQDFANWRHTLALTVRRNVDFTGATFPDPEGALVFALQQPNAFPASGILQIQLQGTTTTTTLWLLNTAVEAIALADWLGVAPSFDYTFNGGLITNTNPF
jgi:hypothetical protein